MDSLKASIRNETEKLLLKKKNIVFLMFSIAVTIVGATLISIFQNSIGISAISGSDYPVLMLGIFTGLFLPLYIFMASADTFAGELGSKNLKLVLVRPVTRFKVFISKNVSIIAYGAAHLVAVFIVSSICNIIIIRSGNVLKGIVDASIAYGVALIPLVAVCAVAVFLSQFFKGSSGALTISVLVFMAAKVIALLFPDASRLLPVTYTDWHMLWIGSTISGGRIAEVFMFILSYSIIFFTAGFFLFDRKEM